MTERRPWVAAMFLVFGMAMLAGGAYAYYRMIELPRTWPRSDAVVISSRVINPRGPTDYSPEIVLRLGDGSATRDVRLTPSWSSSSYNIVQAHLQRFPAGQRIAVAVNPANASDVRYDLTASWTNLIVPGVLGLMGVIFTAVGFFATRNEQPADPQQWTVRDAAAEGGETAERGRRTVRLAGTIFTAIGVLIVVIGAFIARSDLAILRSWPQVEGRVVEARVVPSGSSSSRRGSRQMYDTFVTFRYVVNGVTLQSGTTYGVGRERGGAERRVLSYAPGSAHAVWYRPDDPRIIRFDLDNRIAVFAISGGLVLMGVLFAGIGLVLLRVNGPSATDDPESPGVPR